MKNLSILIIILFVFNSCKDKEEEVIDGLLFDYTCTDEMLSEQIVSLDSNIVSEPYSADFKARVSSSCEIYERGFCYSTNNSPTIEDTYINKGAENGEFSLRITKLTENTKYYVKAYIINSKGTYYGNEVSFSTPITPNFEIGDEFGGGIIFYLDNTNKHGLICAEEDLGYAPWSADLCSDVVLEGFNDWFLPSLDNLDILYNRFYLNGTGNFISEYYWSSDKEYFTDGQGNEYSYPYYYEFHFSHNYIKSALSSRSLRVRAIRSF